MFGGLEFLTDWRPYFLGGAALVLLTSWVMFFQRRTVTCNSSSCTTSAPTKRTALLLSIGTAFVALSVVGLRGRKSVNAGLRTTIRDLPHRFLAYNNGIVATVDSMEVEDSGNGQFRIKSVRGLQIVNGGQTTASLHRAKRQDGAKLEGISVPAKIICVGGADLDEMVAAVSKSANSQNTVQPADFSANDPFHVTVEKLANNAWLPDGKGRWFYERARGSYGAAELKASFAAGQKRQFAQETPKSAGSRRPIWRNI